MDQDNEVVDLEPESEEEDEDLKLTEPSMTATNDRELAFYMQALQGTRQACGGASVNGENIPYPEAIRSYYYAEMGDSDAPTDCGQRK